MGSSDYQVALSTVNADSLLASLDLIIGLNERNRKIYGSCGVKVLH